MIRGVFIALFLLFLSFVYEGSDMSYNILLWDRDGTITGSVDPNDKNKTILPGVKEVMSKAKYNFVISGCATPESEAQDFDPKIIIPKIEEMMDELPIQAMVFSPKRGGVECWVVVKNKEGIKVIEAHKMPEYQKYIGKFKKPDIGMFVVMRDIAKKEFRVNIRSNSVMIGDTWHDNKAAKDFGVGFVDAKAVHEGKQ